MIFGKPFKPMLLQEVEQPFNSYEYLYEVKFDGIRATIHVGPSKFLIFNRYGKDITNFYPELKNIQKTINQNTIFDGEIVLFNNDKPSFSKLLERAHLKNHSKIQYFTKHYPVTFVAFDCLYQNRSLLTLPLQKRKEVLSQYPTNDYFTISPYILTDGQKLFKEITKLHLEGIVAKKLDSPYTIATRSFEWLKIKNFQKNNFYVGGIFEKENNAVASLYLGEYQANELHFVGKVSIGKKQAFYQKVKQSPTRKTSPFQDYQNPQITYLKPTLTCQIAYLERTKNNHLRQPIFKKESKND